MVAPPVPPPVVPPAEELDQINETFGKVREFMEVGRFSLGQLENNEALSPNRHAALNTWTNYYQSLVMKPGHIVKRLYPVIAQCETVNA